jgi:hypothetical protein
MKDLSYDGQSQKRTENRGFRNARWHKAKNVTVNAQITADRNGLGNINGEQTQSTCPWLADLLSNSTYLEIYCVPTILHHNHHQIQWRVVLLGFQQPDSEPPNPIYKNLHLTTVHLFYTIETNQLSSSTSLAPKPLKFGLAFPHDRRPFRSVQRSSSPSFHTHIPQVQFDLTHPPKLRSSCFSPSSRFALQWLLCRPFAIRSYMIKPGQSTHFNYSYNIWKLKYIINFLTHCDSLRVLFIYLSTYFPFPRH